jgi:PAS domain S-box-containing protein
MVWLADGSGSTNYFNERGTDYTGLPRQANYGWQWVNLVHQEDAGRARLGWEHATQTATPFALTYRIRRRDGEFRWHSFRALPVRGANGEVLRWIGTADDLAERTHLVDDDTAVRRQIEQLRMMLEVIQPAEGDRFGFVDSKRQTARVNALLAPDDALEPPLAVVAGSGTDQLTPRELAVLRLVASGHTNAEIANLLGVSLRTVEVTRARLRKGLGLRTRAELVRFARDSGLLDP